MYNFLCMSLGEDWEQVTERCDAVRCKSAACYPYQYQVLYLDGKAGWVAIAMGALAGTGQGRAGQGRFLLGVSL